MSDGDAGDPLRALGRRLEAAQRGRPKPAVGAPQAAAAGEARRALGVGLRIGLELVVAVCVGAALGWAFDGWLGTGPWGMILCLFLGFAGGVANVFRVALGMERAVGFAPPPPRDAWSDDEE
jgi:ATP synthase protein I